MEGQAPDTAITVGRPKPTRLAALGIGAVVVSLLISLVTVLSSGRWLGGIVILGIPGLAMCALGIVAIVRAYRPCILVDDERVVVPRWPLRDVTCPWRGTASVIAVGPLRHPTALLMVPRRSGSIVGLTRFNWPVESGVVDRLQDEARDHGVDVISQGTQPPPVELRRPSGQIEQRFVVKTHLEPWMWVWVIIWAIPGFAVIVSGFRQGEFILGALTGVVLFLALPIALVTRAVTPLLVIDRLGVRGGVVHRKRLSWDSGLAARVVGAGSQNPTVVVEERDSPNAERIRLPLRLLRMRLSDLAAIGEP